MIIQIPIFILCMLCCIAIGAWMMIAYISMRLKNEE